MPNENVDEIFDFESLFEKKNKEDKPESSPIMPLSRAIITVVVYFFIMLFVAGFAVLGFYEVESFTNEYTVEESMLYNIESNPYALGYMITSSYNALESEYPDVKVIYTTASYVFLANKNNEYLTETYGFITIRNFYQTSGATWRNDLNSEYVVLLMFEEDTAFRSFMSLETFENASSARYPKAFTEITPSASAILNFTIYILLAISILPITLNTLKVEATYLKKPLKQLGIDAVIGYAYMMLASIAAQFLILGIGFLFDYSQPVSLNQQAIERSLLSSTGILMILMTVIFAPVLEELVFRKSMFRFFKNQYVAMVVSSLIFGLIHVTSETHILDFITNLISYSASGFALGYVYIRNKNNVWSSILVHAVANAVSIIIILVGALL